MPAPFKYHTTAYKGVDTSFKARVQSPPGTLILQATTASISYTVVEQLGPQAGTSTGAGSPTVASSVFDALQLTSDWIQDNTGYNFAVTIPASAFPDAGDYVVVFLITPTGGGSAYPIIFFHHADSIS
jgi:hypothetical protein